MEITKNSTSNILRVFIQDSTSTVGAGLANLTYASSGLTAYYIKKGDTSPTQITLADITTLGTYVSGGFKAVDNTNMPGLYELHLPNACFTAAGDVHFMYKGATNMVALPFVRTVTEVDMMNATSMGLSRLDADITSRSTLTAQGVWDVLTSALTTANSVGKLIIEMLNATIGSRLSSEDYTAPATPPTAEAIRTEMEKTGTKLTLIEGIASQFTFTNNKVNANAETTVDMSDITDAIALIPTNPLLATDSRLNYLDASISSRMEAGGGEGISIIETYDYVTFDDVENEIMNLSQLIPEGKLDTDYVTGKIAYAVREINGRLSSRYAVPFSPVPQLVQVIALDITCYRLLRPAYVKQDPSVSDWVDDYYKRADTLLKSLEDGSTTLDTVTDQDESSAMSTNTDYAQDFSTARVIDTGDDSTGTLDPY